jgi:hypothetical protein
MGTFFTFLELLRRLFLCCMSYVKNKLLNNSNMYNFLEDI